MAEFVKQRRADFLAVLPLISIRCVPDVFQKQDDLRGQRLGRCSDPGKWFADEQSKRVRFNAILLQRLVGACFK